jgi:hypothetical protein
MIAWLNFPLLLGLAYQSTNEVVGGFDTKEGEFARLDDVESLRPDDAPIFEQSQERRTQEWYTPNGDTCGEGAILIPIEKGQHICACRVGFEMKGAGCTAASSSTPSAAVVFLGLKGKGGFGGFIKSMETKLLQLDESAGDAAFDILAFLGTLHLMYW